MDVGAWRGGEEVNCPNCDKSIDYSDVYDKFVGSDYQNTFAYPCPYCRKMCEVSVHSVPEFTLERLVCSWCQKADVQTGEAYCKPCRETLKAMRTAST